MKKTTYLVLTVLVALTTTACHKPTFEDMQPTKPKWALSVVATADTEPEKQQVQNVANQLTQGAMTAQVTWVAPTEAANTVDKLTQQGSIDLIVLEAGTGVQELVKKHSDVRFAVVGDPSEPQSQNVRHIALDPNRVAFLAGFLAAEANKTSAEPFSVLVDQPLPADDPTWQMILAGNRLAGRKDVPLQVQKSAFVPPTESQTPEQAGQNGRTQTQKQQAYKPPQLAGRSMVLLTDVPEQAWPKIRAKGMGVIRTGENASPLPEQANVLAEPAKVLEQALREEADLLQKGTWSGQQKAIVQSKRVYKLVNPAFFPDRQNIATRLELFEDQLAAGSMKLEDVTAATATSGAAKR